MPQPRALPTARRTRPRRGCLDLELEFPMNHHAFRGALVVAALLGGVALAPLALAQDFDPNAQIRIGSLYEPQNLDNTAGAGQGINEAFNGNVYEALFQLTDAGSVEPQLVESYEQSEDGLTYTFK